MAGMAPCFSTPNYCLLTNVWIGVLEATANSYKKNKKNYVFHEAASMN